MFGDETEDRFKLQMQLAREGNSSAQTAIGEMYLRGYGVSKNYNEAVKWFRLAADQGDPFAQYNLGLMYQHGTGVNKDYQEARKWFQMAANQGHTSAKLSLKALDSPQEEIVTAHNKPDKPQDTAKDSLNPPKQGESSTKDSEGPFSYLQEEEVVIRKRPNPSRVSSNKSPGLSSSTAEQRNDQVQDSPRTSQLVKKVSPAVVFIKGKTSSGSAFGSGFIISPDGKIITNLHVIKELESGGVQLANGERYNSFLVLGFDEQRDLAIIKIAGFDLPVVEMGNSNKIEPGDPVIVMGNPEGFTGSITTGIISSIRSDLKGYDHKVLQIDAAVNPGSSGGPVVDSTGKAVGVVVSGIRDAQNLNFAIPINYARGLLGNLSVIRTLNELRTELKNTQDVFQTSSSPSTSQSLWKDAKHGRQYVVRFDGPYLYTERVYEKITGSLFGISGDVLNSLAYGGQYELGELKLQGDIYFGEENVSRSKKKGYCRMTIKMEIRLVTPNRIEGVWIEPEINWKKCKIKKKEKVYRYPFVWLRLKDL